MRGARRWTVPEDDDAADSRQTRSLAGLAAALALVVVALLVIRALHVRGELEECLISGRVDCAAWVAAGP